MNFPQQAARWLNTRRQAGTPVAPRALAVALIMLGPLFAQTAPAARPSVTGGPGGYAYPSRPPGDPAAIARGRALYDTNCSFCHGEDARGGAQGGPNLIRSDVSMRDQNGELLAPI